MRRMQAANSNQLVVGKSGIYFSAYLCFVLLKMVCFVPVMIELENCLCCIQVVFACREPDDRSAQGQMESLPMVEAPQRRSDSHFSTLLTLIILKACSCLPNLACFKAMFLGLEWLYV